MEAIFLSAAIAVTIGLDAWISVRLVRSHSYSPGQKAAQLVVIWLLPLIGSIAVWAVLSQHAWTDSGADLAETHLQQRGVTWGDFTSHDDGNHVD
jgi:hypothetical protein